MSLSVESKQRSLNTKLFIKEETWKAAKILAENRSANFITQYDIIHQMCQSRTHFFHRSTYLCCRSSNKMTDDTRPYTVFTIAGYDNFREDSDYRFAAKLFRKIAFAIVEGSGVLAKEHVDGVVSAGKIKSTLIEIQHLFCNDTTTLSIIATLN